ncbi:hypothetical protein CEXT_161171, partial [Caerostris extrusa]
MSWRRGMSSIGIPRPHPWRELIRTPTRP